MIKGTKDRPSVKSLKRVVTPGSSSSLITRSKNHFGLGLIDLGTHLKKMLLCSVKYSQDGSSNNLY